MQALSREAIAANPAFSRMTAGNLQGWAANRIGGAPAAAPPPSVPAVDPVPTLEPGDDFLVDRKTMEVLSQDQFGKRGSVSTHLLAIDSKGNIYTTELDRGTQKFVFKGMGK